MHCWSVLLREVKFGKYIQNASKILTSCVLEGVFEPADSVAIAAPVVEQFRNEFSVTAHLDQQLMLLVLTGLLPVGEETDATLINSQN